MNICTENGESKTKTDFFFFKQPDKFKNAKLGNKL